MTTPPSAEAVAHATTARQTALVGLLAADHAPPAGDFGPGMAQPAVLRASGPDAASFLHSQLTNDVEGLEGGAGNLNARVSRTGHLEHVFSLHRDVTGDGFTLISAAEHVQGLHDGLDGFLFADDCTLALAPAMDWLAVQGPKAADLLDAVFGPLGFEPWSTLPTGAIRTVRRARKTLGIQLPAGAFAVRRSLTGDVGFLVALPADSEAWGPLTQAVRHAASELGATCLDADAFAPALEVLRIEAGVPRVGPDTPGKRRLLPETGLEQSAVSYTKGCYLGQEVIARVRTYGSVPNLLRALVLHPRGAFDEHAAQVLAELPPVGATLRDADTGKKAGVLTSRTWSPVAGAPVALAYLGRDVRTPGRELTLREGDDGPVFRATVALLPLYSAPDSAAKVQQLYDRAIRTFADGDEAGALSLLEQALALDPSFADAYEAIGVMLGRAEKFHEAIDVFRRLEEVAPDAPMVNTNLSLYYMKLGDKQTAEDEAGKATLKSMAAARGRPGAGATVDEDLEKAKKRDAERKKKMFEQVLEIDEADPIALFGMGTALLTLEQYEEAADWLARALEVDQRNSPVYAARGKALEKLDRFDDAIAVYQQGVEVASRNGDLMPLKEMEHRLLLLGR